MVLMPLYLSTYLCRDTLFKRNKTPVAKSCSGGSSMSDQWRILVVEDNENLNQSTVNSLRKDGYLVEGTRSGADAIRILWLEEYDVVIGDLKMPGADGLELLQWLRAFRPNTRMMMIATVGSPAVRTQALEGGAVSYLEKPLDLHLLKEELRRLLQQTGFTANLNSFDLLDVIQIINMSRKSIALLVSTGLEERGVLRFQTGELIWAEYGFLQGEEAFFALAAHKNGTVTQQPWSESITPNVMQPLSRLIFQSLQYRSKYAAIEQPTGGMEPVARQPMGHLSLTDIDDSPFAVLAEEQFDGQLSSTAANDGDNDGYKEWWQQTGKFSRTDGRNGSSSDLQPVIQPAPTNALNTDTPIPHERSAASSGPNIIPLTVRKTVASQHSDLPAWLTEHPTNDMPVLRPSSLSSTAKVPSVSSIPGAPTPKPPPAEWQPTSTPPVGKASEGASRKGTSGPNKKDAQDSFEAVRSASSAEWQPIEQISPASSTSRYSGPLQSLSPSRRTIEEVAQRLESGPLANAEAATQRSSRRNYPALVAALQTLGYSITGFIAAAVVSLDGQPIAQVAVDDLDISQMCKHFSLILQGSLFPFGQEQWGDYEDTVITSSERHILLRLVGGSTNSFQVLITTRESDPVESLEGMAKVEGAISAALR
jgi:DNA-binding response OmpR family regulator/predicted regulator of Ras-like GTPase activity (Roadblock/LC7/MglB family)